MITITSTPTGLRITRDALIIDLDAASVPTAIGPIIAELALGVPWNAPAQPTTDDADFASAWNAAARLAGNRAA